MSYPFGTNFERVLIQKTDFFSLIEAALECKLNGKKLEKMCSIGKARDSNLI